jgi:hypothetical protein
MLFHDSSFLELTEVLEVNFFPTNTRMYMRLPDALSILESHYDSNIQSSVIPSLRSPFLCGSKKNPSEVYFQRDLLIRLKT